MALSTNTTNVTNMRVMRLPADGSVKPVDVKWVDLKGDFTVKFDERLKEIGKACEKVGETLRTTFIPAMTPIADAIKQLQHKELSIEMKWDDVHSEPLRDLLLYGQHFYVLPHVDVPDVLKRERPAPITLEILRSEVRVLALGNPKRINPMGYTYIRSGLTSLIATWLVHVQRHEYDPKWEGHTAFKVLSELGYPRVVAKEAALLQADGMAGRYTWGELAERVR